MKSNTMVHLKAHMTKHSYNTDLPDDQVSPLWMTIEGKTCALSFTVDLFGNLIVFDPQNGEHT